MNDLPGGDQIQLDLVKNKIELYNREYLKHDNKTMETFFSKRLEANHFLRQIEGIKNKVGGMDLLYSINVN
jgi:hypothetical protein